MEECTGRMISSKQDEGGRVVAKANDRKSGISNLLMLQGLLMHVCGQSADRLYCHTGKPWSQDFRVLPVCE